MAKHGALNALRKYGPAHLANLRALIKERQETRERLMEWRADKAADPENDALDDQCIADLIRQRQELAKGGNR